MATVDGYPHGTIYDNRFVLSGVTLTDTCPRCGAKTVEPLGELPIDKPPMNKPFTIDLWCPACDQKWQVPLFLTVTVHVHTPEAKYATYPPTQPRSNDPDPLRPK